MDYDDGRVACTDDAVLIRWYYFPVGTKRVPYEKIREASLRPLGTARIWGSSDLVHWYNLDFRRPGKDTALTIDTGRAIKPIITPDEPEKVAAALAAHGVKVTR
ncbi:MAG: hypothetical protein ACRDRN_16960 [Sciscionella sp.]